MGNSHLPAYQAHQKLVHQVLDLNSPKNRIQKANMIGTDARFEVLGAPYSVLSVSLSASQNLYTRRGTLVGLSGKAENV